MARQRTRRKIELGWFEAVVLLLGYVGSLAVVGAAGIYIGQRALPERLLREERVLRLPMPADGGGSGENFGRADPEMTFRRLLGQKKPSSQGKIIVPEKAPEEAPARTRTKTKTQTTAKTPERSKRETPAKTTAEQGRERAAVRVSEKAEASQAGALHRPTGTAVAVPREAVRTHDPQAEAEPAVARAEAPASGREAGRRVSPQGVTAEAAATARAIQAGTPGGATPRAEPHGQLRDPGSTGARAGGQQPRVTREAAATARAVASADRVSAPAGTSEGTWSVQVNATMDEALARSLALRLRERGYEAYVVEQLRDEVTWYRVRVGRLESIEKANELVSRLKEKEGLAQAFVASD